MPRARAYLNRCPPPLCRSLLGRLMVGCDSVLIGESCRKVWLDTILERFVEGNKLLVVMPA